MNREVRHPIDLASALFPLHFRPLRAQATLQRQNGSLCAALRFFPAKEEQRRQ